MKQNAPIFINVVALLFISVTLAGCVAIPVQPWEKGMLAKPEMRMDNDKLSEKFSDHIYTSREAAAGGSGVGGGGCGCN